MIFAMTRRPTEVELPAQAPRSMYATSSSTAHLLLVTVVAAISMMFVALVPSSIAVMIVRIAAVISLRVMAMVARIRMTVVVMRLAPIRAVFAMVTLPVAVVSMCWARTCAGTQQHGTKDRSRKYESMNGEHVHLSE